MTICTTLYLDFCIWLPPTVLSQKAVARMERLNTSVLEEYKTFVWQTRNAWSLWSNGKNSSTQILCHCDKFLPLRYGKIPNENQQITLLFKAYLVCRLSEISPCFLFTISTLEQKHWWQNILLKALLTSISLGKLHCMPVFHYQAKNFWSYSIRSLTLKFEQVYKYVHLPFILQLFSFHFERFPTADFASTKLNKFGIGNKLGNPGSANSFGVHQGGSAGSMNNGGSGNGLLPESLIWTYVVQLTAALRHIHTAGLACRTLDPTKILVINKTR